MEITDDIFESASTDIEAFGDSAEDIFEISDEFILGDEEGCEVLAEELSEETPFFSEEDEESAIQLSGLTEGLSVPAGADMPQKNPMATATLAELYISQGFIPAGLKIYRELLAAEPGNPDYARKCRELQQKLENESLVRETAGDEGDAAASSTMDLEAGLPLGGAAISASFADDRIVSELESWLHNIRRRRDVN